MNSEPVLPASGGKEVQQATGLQDILQVEVIYREVHSLVQGQISGRSESERCTNVNSNHWFCWNRTAEIGDSISGYYKYNVVQQGGIWHREVMPPSEEYDDIGSKEVIQIL